MNLLNFQQNQPSFQSLHLPITAQRFISSTIKSVQQQNSPQLGAAGPIDCSQMKWHEVVKKFSKKRSAFSCFNTRNSGAAAAR